MKQQQVTIFRSMRHGLRPMVFYSLYQAVGNAVVGFKCLPIPLLLNIVSYLPLFDDELVVGKLARTVNPVLVDFL